MDQYRIRARIDILKDDVQAVIPILKVRNRPPEPETFSFFYFQATKVIKLAFHERREREGGMARTNV